MQQFCNSCDEYRDVVIESDCWSCVYDRAVVATEERIIKLLEEMPTKAIKTEHGSQILSLELKDIIALIKGEK